MCGLAGFIGAGTLDDLNAMSRALQHRGPDGEGVHVEAGIGLHLAHRRLAILDIAGGHQPMWNEDEQICVVFNGEIYNHAELRQQLVARGHRFRSDHSDTEVLVHGYEEWGDELPQKLNGMFAFAVFDRPAQRLLLARDRFGEKPLYYLQQPGLFAFGSEASALLAHSKITREIDRTALQKFFAYALIPAPLSLYRNVRKLPAGHLLGFDITRQRCVLREYWRFRIESSENPPPGNEEDWTEQIAHLLGVAVRSRLISDVPLGIFLSGGVDSSAIAALARQTRSRAATKTFSIGFEEASYDESHYARQVAEFLATEHHESILNMDAARALMPEVLSRLDEPIADSSILPTYLLCRFARQHVTVALGGDGGDELFAGYDPFAALGAATLYQRWIPAPIHLGLRALVERLPIGSRNMSLDFKLRRTLRGLCFGPQLWNPVWLGTLDPREVAELFQEPIDPEALYAEAIEAWNQSTATTTVDRTLEFFTRIYLPDDILTKVDRASMMVSMEVRSPFLDNDLVDFVRRLPHTTKYRRGVRKYIMKRALTGLLPAEIIHRRKKGFGIPLLQWLKDWQEPFDDVGSRALDHDWINARWQAHLHGRGDYRHFLWACLALQYHSRTARVQ